MGARCLCSFTMKYNHVFGERVGYFLYDKKKKKKKLIRDEYLAQESF